MEEIPNIWNSILHNDHNYLFGITTNVEKLSYSFIITDLSNNFWIEFVNKQRLISKLDENGIDIVHDSKLIEFLELLQKLVDDDKNSYQMREVNNGDVQMHSTSHQDIVPLAMTIKLSNKRLKWNFSATLQRDFDDVDKMLKFQLFNTIRVHKGVIEELGKEIKLKDRILQTLLENFLESNESYNSSLEEDGLDFKKRVESNKQLNKIIPNSSHLKNSMFKFNFDDFLQNLKFKNTEPFIWSSIQNAIADKRFWELSNKYTLFKSDNNNEFDTQAAIPITNMQNVSSEFINFDDLKPTPAINRSTSPKRRKIDDFQETKIETPSPVKKKVFGVIGGNGNSGETTPSRKRKLKAGTNSPIKAPRLI